MGTKINIPSSTVTIFLGLWEIFLTIKLDVIIREEFFAIQTFFHFPLTFSSELLFILEIFVDLIFIYLRS